MARGAIKKKQRGAIDVLPSGAYRVRVYAGKDQVTGRALYLTETIPPGPTVANEAEVVRTRFLNEVDEKRNRKTTATVSQLLDRYLTAENFAGDRNTLDGYVEKAKTHIRPLIGKLQVGQLDSDNLDSFYGELRRCRAHCDRRRSGVDHRTRREHTCDPRCTPHKCVPLAPSTIRQIHFILSGAMKKAVRWKWLMINPMTQAEPPAAPKPDPQPPSPEQAALILNEAWNQPDFGTLLWLAMTTGVRRGELCALRWERIHKRHAPGLDGTVHLCGEQAGCEWVLMVRSSIAQRGRETWEKDTKTHQQRQVTLDTETIIVLEEHWTRCAEQATSVGVELAGDAFIFSLAPDSSTYSIPDSVSQRYERMVARLGIKTLLKNLRHYSATELIAAGVDIRTVAGRLGHSGGGTTTLRVYAAFIAERDQRAAGDLSARMPARPRGTVAQGQNPFEKIASEYRYLIKSGEFTESNPFPTTKEVAQRHFISTATAHRVIGVLKNEGLISISRGVRAQVLWTSDELVIQAAEHVVQVAADRIESEVTTLPSQQDGRRLLDLEVLYLGSSFRRIEVEADPDVHAELQALLVDVLRRKGHDLADIRDFEVDVRMAGDDTVIKTFVPSTATA